MIRPMDIAGTAERDSFGRIMASQAREEREKLTTAVHFQEVEQII
jgi:hypothetical protein